MTFAHYVPRNAALALLTLACLHAPAGAADAPHVDCSRHVPACPVIAIAGEHASSVTTFSGFADPSLRADPRAANRLWLLYSYLDGRPATGAGGERVGVPHVSTRFARSDDGGVTWQHAGELWSSPLVADPEQRGPPSYFGSESTGLAAVAGAGGVTWYSVRLSYFLEPVTAYAPRFATSWTIRVAAARGDSPAALASAPEAVLGTSTTGSVYGVHVRLTSLSTALSSCAFFNNPAIEVQGDRLYLLAECVVVDGARPSAARSRIVVFRTRPSGIPSSWHWEYAGVLADAVVAGELGARRLVSPNVSRARDGAYLLLVTPQGGPALIGQGCLAVELASLDPPAFRRDASGRIVTRAVQTARADGGWHTGACTHDAASATGIVTVAASTANGLRAELRGTGLRP